jgi:hypothetical protein
LDISRNELGGNVPIPVCNVRLTLNGSDYEMVEILEDKNIIPDLEISDLKTDKGIIYFIINAWTTIPGIELELECKRIELN